MESTLQKWGLQCSLQKWILLFGAVTTVLTMFVYKDYITNVAYIPRISSSIPSDIFHELINALDKFSAPPPNDTEVKVHLFDVRLSPLEKQRFFTLLDMAHNVTSRHNLTYFLVFGTLLGSYRHHDIVPWDDDMDIYVSFRDKEKFRNAYKNITDHVYYPTGKYSAKLSLSYGRRYDTKRGGDVFNLGYEYTYPFLDVFYYKDNTTHLTGPQQKKPLRLSVIFPLQLRPMNQKLYFAPRDPYRYLKELDYGLDECFTGGYNHSIELRKRREETATLPCANLVNKVPFVTHVRGPGGAFCLEHLTSQGKVLSSFSRSKRGIPEC